MNKITECVQDLIKSEWIPHRPNHNYMGVTNKYGHIVATLISGDEIIANTERMKIMSSLMSAAPEMYLVLKNELQGRRCVCDEKGECFVCMGWKAIEKAELAESGNYPFWS